MWTNSHRAHRAHRGHNEFSVFSVPSVANSLHTFENRCRTRRRDMEQYGKFGKFYDAVMGSRAGSAAFIHNLIWLHKPEAKTLLELACGTGAVLEPLSEHYQVAGIDISIEMLSVARKKLPGAPLVQSDMVTFELGQMFDVIICVFDSINLVLGNAIRWSSTDHGCNRRRAWRIELEHQSF